MKRSDFFSFINSLGSSPLFLSSVPDALRSDFDAFMYGRTIGKKDDQFFAYPNDAKEWKTKLVNQGLSIDVQIEK